MAGNTRKLHRRIYIYIYIYIIYIYIKGKIEEQFQKLEGNLAIIRRIRTK
jgi:hypothetical protein